jgi:tetratricopeptide (TPR) repeat protein
MSHQSKSNNEGKERGFHLDEHLVLDFLLGCLSPTENEKVLLHLTECPACEKLFQRRVAESERFDATRILHVLPDGELAVERRGTAARAKSWESPNLWSYLIKFWQDVRMRCSRPRFQLAGGLAAVTALFLIVWFHGVRTSDTSPLYLLRPYSFQLQSREVPGTAPGEDFKAGLDAYNNKEFKLAIELLQRAKDSEQTAAHETIRRVYLGSAFAWNGDYEEAIEILETIPFPLVPPEWSREAHWTLYIAMKESGRDESADSLIEILSGKPGKVGERARTLLKQ